MNEKQKRVLMSIFGVILCGLMAGTVKYASFGVDPFQCFCFGMNGVVPLDYGTLYLLINLALLLLALVADRHYVGLATVLNMLFLGYVVQFACDAWAYLLPDPALAARIALMAVGLVGLCLSLSLYITADMGVSSYDAVALLLANKWHVARFRVCRIMSDVVCVTLGAAMYLLGSGTMETLGSVAGIGTIITAFCMGPLIEVFNTHVSRPLLYGKA